MEQDIPSPEVKDNLEAHKIAEEEPKESHENYNDKKISGENHLEKLVEDEDENGQAGQYFVERVTGRGSSTSSPATVTWSSSWPRTRRPGRRGRGSGGRVRAASQGRASSGGRETNGSSS